MPTEQTLSIGYGKVNYDTSSAGLFVFVAKPNNAPAPMIRAFPSEVMTRKGKTQVFPSTSNEKIGGKMLMDTLTGEDGHVICVQNSHRFNGSMMRDGAVFLRLRADGAVYAVTAKLPVSTQSLVGDSFLAFQGAGDLMSLDDLRDMSILPSRSWIENYMSPDEIAQTFDIIELRPEIVARPQQTSFLSLSGETRFAIAPVRQRRLKVR